jgi:CO/xanthine dehydrogenase Mo-binding subunit
MIAAVTDALGVTHVDMPATPAAIWDVLQTKTSSEDA